MPPSAQKLLAHCVELVHGSPNVHVPLLAQAGPVSSGIVPVSVAAVSPAVPSCGGEVTSWLPELESFVPTTLPVSSEASDESSVPPGTPPRIAEHAEAATAATSADVETQTHAIAPGTFRIANLSFVLILSGGPPVCSCIVRTGGGAPAGTMSEPPFSRVRARQRATLGSLEASMRALPCSALMLCALFLAEGTGHAQSEADKGQAREFGSQAIAAGDHGDWAKAEDLFRRAEELYDAPTLLLGLARARVHLGKYVEASEAYHRILAQALPANASPALRQAVDDAKKEIASVEAKRGGLTINVTGADHPVVTLDGMSIPAAALGGERPVNPGNHAIHVEAEGFDPSDTTTSVTEGGTATANIVLKHREAAAAQAPSAAPAPAAPAPSAGGGMSTGKVVGVAGIGVGAVGLVVGVITGALAMGKHSDLTSSPCATAPCSQSALTTYQSTDSSYSTLSTVSTVGFIAGGVLAAAGVVLFISAPKGDKAPASAWIAPYVGAGSVGAVGRF